MKFFIIVLFGFFLNNTIIAQKDSAYLKLDTLMFYIHQINSFGDGSTAYGFSSNAYNCTLGELKGDKKGPLFFANCQEICKEDFDSLKATKNNSRICKPCVLEQFNDSGNIIISAVQYTDCYVGEYIEYYQNGQVKIKGHYKKNDSGKWKRLYKRGFCSVKGGAWTYFNIKGEEVKKEIYKDGLLVK